MRIPRLNRLSLSIKILMSVTILAALCFRMDTHILADLARHFNLSAWLLATLFVGLQFILLSARWQVLINIGGRKLRFADALQISLISQLANLVFITSIGGMVARVALSVHHGARLMKTCVATLFDRMMTLAALLLLAALFLPGLSAHIDSRSFHTLSTYVSATVVTLFVFAPLFTNFVLMRLPQTALLKGRMRFCFRYLKILLGRPVLIAKLAGLSLVAQLAMFVSVFILAQSTGADLSFLQMMTVLPMISVVASLPIGFGGWGLREGAFVYGLGLLGVPMETAFLISIQLGLISMLATVAAGLPALMTSNIPLEKLTRFGRPATLPTTK